MAWCTVLSQQSKERLFREALQSHCSPRSYLQRQPLNVGSTLFDQLMSKSFLRKFCAIRIQRIHVTLIETSLQAFLSSNAGIVLLQKIHAETINFILLIGLSRYLTTPANCTINVNIFPLYIIILKIYDARDDGTGWDDTQQPKNMIRSDACKSKRQDEIIILPLLYLSTSISGSVASPVFNLSKH